MTSTFSDLVFYHIYPLGAFGAPRDNDGRSPAVSRLDRLSEWIPAMKAVGANALYLGPVFESERHGYDTIDYLSVDRRLGTNDDLADIAQKLRENGISLVLDAVFNHVGRRHPFVQDVAEMGAASRYAPWIAGFDQNASGRGGLPFSYEGWNGHYDLVKLDTGNPDVREYLIDVALTWIDKFGISGLRLDAADCLDVGFLRMLSERCREKNPDFFLIGEAVHGDRYAPLINGGGLDSITNYEAWKGLWSSYNDRNYFEIAWTLNRLFGGNGLIKGRNAYSFADNHDVDRVASMIRDPAGLYPLYALLFAMPGVPSIYYGSEYAFGGKKIGGDDGPLRPEIDPKRLSEAGTKDLARAIGRFSEARRRSSALRNGSYRPLVTEREGISFMRSCGEEHVVVAVNGSTHALFFPIADEVLANRGVLDLLDSSYTRRADHAGRVTIEVPPHWTRWLAAVS